MTPASASREKTQSLPAEAVGIARCFIQAGARVILVGRRHEELAKACDELGGNAFFAVQDITDFDGTEETFVKLVSQHGPPIILINNAGTHLKKLAVDTRPDEFEAVMRTHLTAAHNLNRLALPGMLETPGWGFRFEHAKMTAI